MVAECNAELDVLRVEELRRLVVPEVVAADLASVSDIRMLFTIRKGWPSLALVRMVFAKFPSLPFALPKVV